MGKIIVNGNIPLSGSVSIHGAKNAVLPILAATVMVGGVHIIHNCPNFSDVSITIEILESLGAQVTRSGSTLTVDTRGELGCVIPEHLMRKLRSSVIFMGAVLARNSQAKISTPGGCELGPRPIDLHLKALAQLGAEIKEEHGYLICSAKTLVGKTIHLDFPSVGATENLLLSASMAEGETVILNAAREPEIEDLAMFLNNMGADVRGAGTGEIQITGKRKLTPSPYTVMPDRIVAATYLCAAAATGGCVTVTEVCPEHLSAVLSVLSDCGCELEKTDTSVTLKAPKQLTAPGSIKTMPYPGFPTDAQSLFLAMLCRAKGTSIITETIFESRFKPVPELCRMGAKINVGGRVAVICGVENLWGTTVTAEDLRGGASLVIAALSAKGKTEIMTPEYIDRGYERLEKNLVSLGADIRRE